MLGETLVVLAAAGGTAVVQHTKTEAWPGLRLAVARWFGRGDEQRERTTLERLDRTFSELETAEAEEYEQVHIRLQATWQTLIEAVLEDLGGTELTQAAEDLRGLLAQHAPSQGGLTISGDVNIRAEDDWAEDDWIAVGVVHGSANTGRHVVGHTPPGMENDPDDDWPQES